jgi:HSP20 family protein
MEFVVRTRLGTFAPNADVFVDEDKCNVIVVVEVAGADAESLSVYFDESGLVIAGRRIAASHWRRGSFVQKEIARGDFVKRIPLPVAIEYDRISASYDDGLLVVVAPIAVTAYMPTSRTELHLVVKRTHS